METRHVEKKKSVYSACLICHDSQIIQANTFIKDNNLDDKDINICAISDIVKMPFDRFLCMHVQFWIFATDRFVMNEQCKWIIELLLNHKIGSGNGRYLIPIWIDSRRDLCFVPMFLRPFKGIDANKPTRIRKMVKALSEKNHEDMKYYLLQELGDKIQKETERISFTVDNNEQQQTENSPPGTTLPHGIAHSMESARSDPRIGTFNCLVNDDCSGKKASEMILDEVRGNDTAGSKGHYFDSTDDDAMALQNTRCHTDITINNAEIVFL